MPQNLANKIYIEQVLVERLLTQTIDLIHSTMVISAIKKLTQAYDILHLNQEIMKRFKESKQFCWDKGAVTDLDYIGKELVIYHRMDFTPEHIIYDYNGDIKKLVHVITVADRIYNP